jgi:hypothetical protein
MAKATIVHQSSFMRVGNGKTVALECATEGE